MSSSYSVHGCSAVKPTAYAGSYSYPGLDGDGWLTISFAPTDTITIHNQSADSMDYLAQRINEAAQEMREREAQRAASNNASKPLVECAEMSAKS